MSPRVSEETPEALRVVGRLVALAGVTLAVIMVLGMALKPILPAGLPPGRDGRILMAFIVAVALGVAQLVVTALLERGRFEAVGLAAEAWRPVPLAAGFLLGLTAVAGAAATLLALGLANVEATAPGEWSAFAADALVLIGIFTLVEALVARGYVFGLFERWLGVGVAVVASALLATLMQTWQRGATPSQFVAVLALGLFLGAVRARTGNVVAAWCTHWAIAAVLAVLFHATSAPLELGTPPDYRLALGVPAWITGAGWGLDGGLAAAFAFVLAAALVLWRFERVDKGRRP